MEGVVVPPLGIGARRCFRRVGAFSATVERIDSSAVNPAFSPADDILDFGVAAVLVHLLGWHWEFLPSFFAKLVPGVDLVPFWTMAVANVYRKSKRIAVTAEEIREQHPVPRDHNMFKP
ncbi:MAG: hypothetical protein WA188_14945 [Terriglobales bacterium]